MTDQKKKIGPTGEYPAGKINEDDEGGLAFSIYVQKGRIVIDFGQSIKWFGMGPDEAIALAKILISHSNTIKMADRIRPSQN